MLSSDIEWTSAAMIACDRSGWNKRDIVNYLLWSLPFAAVALPIASGRASTTMAGFLGLLASIAVSLVSAPNQFGPTDVLSSATHGAWLAFLVGAVILAGLFFREVVSGHAGAAPQQPLAAALRRRQLYTTCFLLGPFAEAATGFGVGQVTVAPLLANMGLTPVHAVLFGLFSQMMVSWGAMANGTMIGAQLSGLAPVDLGVHSALLSVPLIIVWLGLFWRIASIADIPGTRRDLAGELVCTLAAGGLLVVSNLLLGPEVAALAALGPLILARFLAAGRPDRDQWRSARHVGLPYVVLIAGLITTRAVPSVNQFLGDALTVRPFVDGPTWAPLLHPSFWLLAVGLVTALIMGGPALAGSALERAWSRGRRPILTIGLFLAMAQVMSISGVADGLARGLRLSLGPLAAMATPLFAGLFGFLTGSSNAANGLLMPAQAALAKEAGLSLPWLAAIQNVAAAGSTMLSPVRVAVGCALVGKPELERKVYSRAWPLVVVPLALLMVAAALLLF